VSSIQAHIGGYRGGWLVYNVLGLFGGFCCRVYYYIRKAVGISPHPGSGSDMGGANTYFEVLYGVGLESPGAGSSGREGEVRASGVDKTLNPLEPPLPR
jgi:hypothetical protein